MNLKEKFLLFAIILLGFFFRFYGINFDRVCCQHPDERAIVMFALPLSFPSNTSEFLSPKSPLNPHFFAYGNLPLYLLKGTATIASIFDKQLAEYSYINLVGRLISVVADLITILSVFLIGKTLKDKKLGLASAFIYAISVLPIQYSHFYTSDILLTMFVTLTLFRLLKFYNKPNYLNAVFVGIPFGLALSTKVSAIPLLSSITIAICIDFIFIFLKSPHKIKSWLPHVSHVVRKLLTEGLLIFATTAITFFIIQPYVLIDKAEFIAQNLQQMQITRDAYTFPYTLQYVGKTPYIYELKNIFPWGLGPIISIFSAFGLFLIIKSFKKIKQSKKSELIILLSFLTIYFLTVGHFSVGFMRYLLPIYPILAVAAGFSLMLLFDELDKFKNHLLFLALKLLIIILLLIWPLSFMSTYTQTNTRIAATNWINENIPTKSVLTHELWDDQIPMYSNKNYEILELGMYNQPDNKAKWEILNSKLNDADYIVIASNRLYVPIEHLNDCSKYKICFPLASKFYQDLFNNKLKFKKVAEFKSYPTIPILNVPIDDQSADESFTVYDHPKIMIFKRTK